MKKNFVDRFFTELDRELGRPAEIILTGAAAGSLLGNVRPSLDIDFEIRVRRLKRTSENTELAEAIRRASAKIGVAANYSEDISRWSMINYLSYRKAALPYKIIGRLRVKLMAPSHWTIGKMARFYESDLEDILRIVRKRRLKSQDLIPLWGRALALSPLSRASGSFRGHVIYFLNRHGKSLWGKNFDAQKAIALFKREAKIK